MLNQEIMIDQRVRPVDNTYW